MPSTVLALPDQRPALDVAGEPHQIHVSEPIADLGGLAGDRVERSASLPSTHAERPPAAADAPARRNRTCHRRAVGALAPASRTARANSPPLSRTNTSQPAHRAALGTSPRHRSSRRTLPLRRCPHRCRSGTPPWRAARGPRARAGPPDRGRQLGDGVRPRPPAEAAPPARDCLGRRHALASGDTPDARASRGAPSRASVSPDTRHPTPAASLPPSHEADRLASRDPWNGRVALVRKTAVRTLALLRDAHADDRSAEAPGPRPNSAQAPAIAGNGRRRRGPAVWGPAQADG